MLVQNIVGAGLNSPICIRRRLHTRLTLHIARTPRIVETRLLILTYIIIVTPHELNVIAYSVYRLTLFLSFLSILCYKHFFLSQKI